jgi:hypothetical protein
MYYRISLSPLLTLRQEMQPNVFVQCTLGFPSEFWLHIISLCDLGEIEVT